MLRSLFIQNYALIEKLDISFNAGFSVITGETGAGKSVMLGAIGLLTGQRADVKSIRAGASKCVIEAHFDVSSYGMKPFFDEHELEYDNDCILRRELSASGKSRSFINDSPVALGLMKELGEQLIDIHSQHQNLLLNKEDFQLEVLNLIAQNDKLLTDYRQLYLAWRDAKLRLEHLIEQTNQAKVDEDYLRYQAEQLNEANLVAGEQEELEQEVEILSHAEDIKSSLYKAHQLLNADEQSVLSRLKESSNSLRDIQRVYASAQELSERLESCYIEIDDIAHELIVNEEKVEFNPSRLGEVEDRLNQIYALQKKHHVNSVEELIHLANEYTERLSTITSGDERIEELRHECDKLYSQALSSAQVLTETRKEAAHDVEQQMSNRLVSLGMPNVRFKVEITQRKELSPHGMDSVAFLFSANKNAPLQSISSVASGGEIARVMLSVKAMIAGAVKLPTIIFDEIDTGVSGEIADRMADIMQEMGDNNRQVISITHLPQIAARGHSHYKVYKLDNEHETISHIRSLTSDERVEEIAHMLSGATLTEAALNNARSLLSV